MPNMPTNTMVSNNHRQPLANVKNARVIPLFPTNEGCTLPTGDVPTLGQYYMYSSGPKLSPLDRPKDKGESTGKQKGAHDYHSMMWDPRIYRGPTYKTYIKAEKERCKRKQTEENEASNLQRKKGAKRAQQQQHQTPLGGIVRPKTPTHHTNKVGLEDMGIQTERFLEEITDEVMEKDMCTQTDHIFDLFVPPLFCPIKLGLDVETQILPWELFHFDDEAKPIISTVVGKIIEQALFETMEEVELESLKAEQKIYEERHRVELMRLERLHRREQKITEERARLITQRLKEVGEEQETEERVGANLYALNYLGGLANGVLNELRTEGFMINSDGLEDSFIPWLHNRSIWAFCKTGSAHTLLDDVIQSVVDKREAEVADGIWREISAQKDPFEVRPESSSSHNYTNMYLTDDYENEE